MVSPETPSASISAQRPVAAVIAVVERQGHLLLVRRGNAPDVGRWGFPGGKIEFGETVFEAVVRELREETGVRGQALYTMDSVDVLVPGKGRLARHHYVLIAVKCRWLSGEPVAADDALEARWFTPMELGSGQWDLSDRVMDISRQALQP